MARSLDSDPARANFLAYQIKEKKADKPCPRCGNHHFSIVGESALNVRPPGTWGLNARDVPITVVACSNCGFISLHASAILEKVPGLLGGAQ